ncbi:MAG: transposase [Bacteroidales bacterium]|nr:transposase [Bacteroidales bacterium]
MSTYTQILYQVVFGSKNCINFLTGSNQDELYRYIAGILQKKKCFPYIIGGYKNHIHMVFSLHSSVGLSDLVRDVKKASVEMMLGNKSKYLRFPGWQTGYGAFTYSLKSKDALISYVEGQEEHHRKISFMEELINFLEEYNVDYNKKYLFV